MGRGGLKAARKDEEFPARRDRGTLSEIIIVVVADYRRRFRAGVVSDKGTIPRQRDRAHREQFRAGISISASKTCHGESAAVNREPSRRKVGRTVIFLGRSVRVRLVLKGTAGDPLISRWGQNVPGSPGTRLPGGNNDGLSARPPCAIVLCCGMIRAESGRQTATRARRIEGLMLYLRASITSPGLSYILIFTR